MCCLSDILGACSQSFRLRGLRCTEQWLHKIRQPWRLQCALVHKHTLTPNHAQIREAIASTRLKVPPSTIIGMSGLANVVPQLCDAPQQLLPTWPCMVGTSLWRMLCSDFAMNCTTGTRSQSVETTQNVISVFVSVTLSSCVRFH